MGRSVAISLGQNFLRKSDTARRIVELARVTPGDLCIDLGAGAGIITDAARAARCSIWAIELDDRLAEKLSAKYANSGEVEVIHQSLLNAPLPQKPFFITANPPFNQSTLVVRRWLLADSYQGGAFIAQTEFGRKISGDFGATKLSLSVAPFLALRVMDPLSPEQFRPQPRVPTAIVTAYRNPDPLLPWEQRCDYWLFLNYMFERSHPALSDALKPLRLRGLPDNLRKMQVREVSASDAVELFLLVQSAGAAVKRLISTFNDGLSEQRQLNLGEAPVRRTAPPPGVRQISGGRPRPLDSRGSRSRQPPSRGSNRGR